MKDLDQLARDLRHDSGLRDVVAMTLATRAPGDWDALTAALTSRGYTVTADQLQEKLRAVHDPSAPASAMLGRWL